MKLKRILNITITLLLVIGIYGAGNLVWDEIQTGEGCPKIWIIPACAIVLISFLIPLIAHVINKYIPLYFIFTGLALAIAIIASIMQYTGNGQCPKLNNGIPMCYLSLVLCTNLISLKIVQLRLPKTL
jgi:phosphoglycerol transferase MdoB-like AlkP superfamily enzyme